MSRKKVMKFGGSSVADGERIKHCASIVAAHADQGPVVVTSAMMGVTDHIEAFLADLPIGEAKIPVLIDALRSKHEVAARGAITNPDILDDVRYQTAKNIERLERLLYGIAYTEELTARTRDFAMSFGERLAAPVLAGTIRDAGFDSRAFEAEDLGLVTDGVYGNATPRLDEIAANLGKSLVPFLDKGGIPVVTGFYGVDGRGHATVFGRGGSDFVGAILANALDADALEIWKDVPGFMTTDPRTVPNARPLREMSYDEAAELANFGAKVLHPRTVEPVSKKGIPIRVLNTMDPSAEGTLVHHLENVERTPMRAVAARGSLCIVKLIGPGMAYTKGIGQRVFTVLAEHGVNVINMAASQASFALLIDQKDEAAAIEALGSIKGGVIQDIETMSDMALLCVVGKGLSETPGSAATILGVIAAQDVNVEMISLGASDIAIDVIVHARDRQKAVQAVHDKFLPDVVGPAAVVEGAGDAS